mmetsp:Transcript_71063/g.230696  ORF Transcript_71063/g.230696 Transcript_71063/m.230696 type:complete len:475 (+) Transcript_71063:221-1645(+)
MRACRQGRSATMSHGRTLGALPKVLGVNLFRRLGLMPSARHAVQASRCISMRLGLRVSCRLSLLVRRPSTKTAKTTATRRQSVHGQEGEHCDNYKGLVAPELKPSGPGAFCGQPYRLQVAPGAKLQVVRGPLHAAKLLEDPAQHLRLRRVGGDADDLEHITGLHPTSRRASPTSASIRDSLADSWLVAKLRVADDRHSPRHGLHCGVAATMRHERCDLRVCQCPGRRDPMVHQHRRRQGSGQPDLLGPGQGPEGAVAIRCQGADHSSDALLREHHHGAEADVDHRDVRRRRLQKGLHLGREGFYLAQFHHRPCVLHQRRQGLWVVEARKRVDEQEAVPPECGIEVRKEAELVADKRCRMLDQMDADVRGDDRHTLHEGHIVETHSVERDRDVLCSVWNNGWQDGARHVDGKVHAVIRQNPADGAEGQRHQRVVRFDRARGHHLLKGILQGGEVLAKHLCGHTFHEGGRAVRELG